MPPAFISSAYVGHRPGCVKLFVTHKSVNGPRGIENVTHKYPCFTNAEDFRFGGTWEIVLCQFAILHDYAVRNLVHILIEAHSLSRVVESIEPKSERIGDIVGGKDSVNQRKANYFLAIRVESVARVVPKVIG